MTSNHLDLARNGGVVLLTLGVVLAFVEFSLPGLYAFVAQLVAAVACSAFVLRLMDII